MTHSFPPRRSPDLVIDHPTMLKDGSAMGAMAGVSAALLAAAGFTGAPAITVADAAVAEVWGDLGERWRIEEQYVKAYPVCRWAQPAVEAVLSLRDDGARPTFPPQEVKRVTTHRFPDEVRLAPRQPATPDPTNNTPA